MNDEKIDSNVSGSSASGLGPGGMPVGRFGITMLFLYLSAFTILLIAGLLQIWSTLTSDARIVEPGRPPESATTPALAGGLPTDAREASMLGVAMSDGQPETQRGSRPWGQAFGESGDDGMEPVAFVYGLAVRARIREAAEAKAEAAVFYEYSRIQTDRSILQLQIRDEQFSAHHGDVLKGSLERLLRAIEGGTPGLTLELFLRQQTLKITKAWGVTLGVGRFSLGGKAEDEVEEVRRTTRDGSVQLSFSGARSYKSTEGGDRAKWLVDFDAAMPKFSTAGAEPSADEFSYGLYLAYEWSERVSEEEVAQLVDHAVLWMALAPGAAREEIEALSSVLMGKTDVDFGEGRLSRVEGRRGAGSDRHLCGRG